MNSNQDKDFSTIENTENIQQTDETIEKKTEKEVKEIPVKKRIPLFSKILLGISQECSQMRLGLC